MYTVIILYSNNSSTIIINKNKLVQNIHLYLYLCYTYSYILYSELLDKLSFKYHYALFFNHQF